MAIYINGGHFAPLDESGKVPSSVLPSYVDDVLEYASLAALPAAGEAGKIYVAIDTRKVYRWSGSTYIEVSPSSVESVSGRAGAVTLTKDDVGLANVDNTPDASKPVSTAQAAADSAVASAAAADATAKANAAQAAAVQRANHTGTQTISTISDAGTAASRNVPASGDASSTQVVLGSDTRLTDSRAPTSHAVSHGAAGSDPIAISAGQVSGLSAVATSGSYSDLSGKPAAYSLPAATNSTLGGVVVGSGLSVSSGTVSANVTSVASRSGDVTLDHRDVGNLPTTLPQFTTSQNDLPLGSGGIIRVSSSAAVNITGIAAAAAGDARLLSNVGSFAITLKHQNSASSAANRIICANSADIEIPAGGSAVVYYDGVDGRWRAG